MSTSSNFLFKVKRKDKILILKGNRKRSIELSYARETIVRQREERKINERTREGGEIENEEHTRRWQIFVGKTRWDGKKNVF